MNKRPTLSINLLKKKETPSLDLFTHWAITGGRFLVILTETIALAAFLYRFTIDRQVIDLHDQIKAKQIIVDASKEDELRYRGLQSRLIAASQLMQDASVIPEFTSRTTQLAQEHNLAIKSLTITSTNFHIEVTAIAPKDLKDFITELQNQNELSEISVDRIENRTSIAQLAAVISAQTAFALQSETATSVKKGEKE